MNKKGAIADWWVIFMCWIGFVIIILLAFVLFSVTKLNEPSIGKIGAEIGNMKDTDVLITYLNLPIKVTFEDGKDQNIQMVDLIDMYERDKGFWRRVVEKHTQYFLEDTNSYISIGPVKDSLTLNALNIGPEGAIIKSVSDFQISETISIILSQGDVVYVKLFKKT